MKINLETVSNNFSKFAESLGRITEPHLISYAFLIEDFDALSSADALNKFSDDIFIFRTPDDKRSIVGLNSAIEFISDEINNLPAVTNVYNKWKNNFINNWDKLNISSLPIICSSLKFDQLKSSSQWNDFEAVRINVPEFLFQIQNGEAIGCYNFIIDDKTDPEQISKRFFSKLNLLSKLFTESIRNSDDRIVTLPQESSEEFERWKIVSEKALQVLYTGIVEKLVISRPYNFALNCSPEWNILLNQLNRRFPDCYLFFIKRKNSIFFGSSPEMFLKISGNVAEVESVAGSAPRGEKSESDRLLEKVLSTSEKNHREHQYVSEFISDVLKNFSSSVRITEEKQIKKLDNIQHLITRISAELENNNLFELIDSLFPTPAVCGVPKSIAMSFIRKLEVHDRGLYSGLVGWIDFKNNCELAVSIRSALVKENIVTAFAGAGLVKNSDPDEEFQETKLKLDPILSLFKPKVHGQE